jgi:hypothetical protein
VPQNAAAVSGLPVIQRVGDKAVVLADRQACSRLKIRHTVLDRDVGGKDYFLVYPFAGDPGQAVPYHREAFEKYGAVLADFGTCLLMQSTDAKLVSIKEYNVRLDYLEPEPIPAVPPANTIIDTRPKPAPIDPLLQEILGRVNKDSVDRFERDLCAFTNRDIGGTFNKAEVIPYLKKKFLAYGCDSIIELPIRGGISGSTMVAGVRFGVKDRTIKQFTLIGGHPDTKSSEGVTARHQGANDNATGTVGALEAARVHQYYDFDYTIIYAGFNGEEYGLYGSAALVPELEKAGAKVVGGCFNYDMLGLWGTSIRYEVYDSIAGAKEFADRITELGAAYKTYTFTARATATSSQPTDVSNFWKRGYACAWHNWGSGAGIHGPGDSLTSRFDLNHLCGALKTGLVVTSYYAVPHRANVGVRTRETGTEARVLTCRRLPSGALSIALDTKSGGTIAVFDMRGRMMRQFGVKPARSNKSAIIWDGTDSRGVQVSGAALVIVRYQEMTGKVAAAAVINRQ